MIHKNASDRDMRVGRTSMALVKNDMKYKAECSSWFSVALVKFYDQKHLLMGKAPIFFIN